MTKRAVILALLAMLLLCTTIQVQTSQVQTKESVSGSAPGVTCLAPGNRESVTYDYGPDSRLSITIDNVIVGSAWPDSPSGNTYGCMGRCGIDCSGHPATSRMYTQDCLTHDVCSQQQNANNGMFDKSCGDEFRAAIGDTVLALSNICKYRNGNHRRAADGKYQQDSDTSHSPDNNDDGFFIIPLNNDQAVVIPY